MSTSKILSHGSVYLFGNILRRVVSFVMLPIYTRYLTPADYGTIELLSMVIDIVAILFGLRIGEAVFRFYYEYDDEKDRREVIFTSVALVSLLNALGALVLVVGAEPISRVVLGTVDLARLLGIFSFTLIFQSVTETTFTFIRAQQKPWLFVGFSTMKLVVQLALNIYFVVRLRMAAEGVILSSLVSGIVVTIPMLWYTLSRTGFSFSLEKARVMTSFSIPLVVTSLISFYITFGDRYFLRILGGGLDAVGIYALGYRFGFLLSFLVGDPFFSIWNSEKYITAKQPDAQRRFQLVFLMLSAAMVFVMTGISIYVQDVLRIMADPEFWGASLIVPVVLIAYAFNNWLNFTNLGVLLHRKTSEIAIGTAISAGLITIGYLTLIPAFGAIGAAAATAIAFLGRLIWIERRAERLYPLAVPWPRAMGMVGLGTVAWALSFLAPEPIGLSIAVKTLIFLAFTAALLVLPGLLPTEVQRALLLAVRDRRAAFAGLGRGSRPTANPTRDEPTAMAGASTAE